MLFNKGGTTYLLKEHQNSKLSWQTGKIVSKHYVIQQSKMEHSLRHTEWKTADKLSVSERKYLEIIMANKMNVNPVISWSRATTEQPVASEESESLHDR